MTIKFPCPHCKKMLSVKEHLAGKRVACPACKQPITIPQPAPDVEELAAAAFADESAPKEEKAPQFVEFKCYYCDEQVKVNAELAGKQAPCPNPECRRIVKVPLLVKSERKDWRKVDTRTPLVAQQQPQAPEGAWGSTTSQGRVSRQSLEDAAAVPAEPVSAMRWVVRGGVAVAVLAAGLGAWFGINAFSTARLETQAIARAEKLLEDDKLLTGTAAAEVCRGIGEYHLRAQKADQAKARFEQARSPLGKEELTSRERDFVLADLAASQVELGGTAKEVEDRARLKWEEALKEIERTLRLIRNPEVRVEAVREVARRLIARGEHKRAASIAAQVGSPEEVPELTAVVGLELLAAKHIEDAGVAAELALQRFLEPLATESGEPAEGSIEAGKPKEPSARKMPLTPSLIALCVALNRRDEKANVPPPEPTGIGARPVLAIGYAEGLGYRGERARAQAAVETTETLSQVQALVGLATATAADQPDAARADLEKALGILARNLAKNPGRRDELASTLFRLVRVGVRVGMTDALKPAAEAIPDRDMRGRAQLEILRGRLAAKTERVEESIAQEVDKDAPAYPLALAAVARHNARVDGPRAVRNRVDGWEPEKHRPFGYVGVALGSRDARR